MTAYRLTLVARRDVETLVRALARDDLRAAERAVDELCATMEWLGGTPDVGQLRDDLADGAHASRLRCWALRDWLLVYGDPEPGGPGEEPAPRSSREPITFLRVLEMGRPRWT
jgi:plasmid stabilization system protein ParE